MYDYLSYLIFDVFHIYAIIASVILSYEIDKDGIVDFRIMLARAIMVGLVFLQMEIFYKQWGS